jgi:hypothetical protein
MLKIEDYRTSNNLPAFYAEVGLGTWANKMKERGHNLLVCLEGYQEYKTTVFYDSLYSRNYLNWVVGDENTTIDLPRPNWFNQLKRISPLVIAS